MLKRLVERIPLAAMQPQFAHKLLVGSAGMRQIAYVLQQILVTERLRHTRIIRT